jgi:hypothetical protein
MLLALSQGETGATSGSSEPGWGSILAGLGGAALGGGATVGGALVAGRQARQSSEAARADASEARRLEQIKAATDSAVADVETAQSALVEMEAAFYSYAFPSDPPENRSGIREVILACNILKTKVSNLHVSDLDKSAQSCVRTVKESLRPPFNMEDAINRVDEAAQALRVKLADERARLRGQHLPSQDEAA